MRGGEHGTGLNPGGIESMWKGDSKGEKTSHFSTGRVGFYRLLPVPLLRSCSWLM